MIIIVDEHKSARDDLVVQLVQSEPKGSIRFANQKPVRNLPYGAHPSRDRGHQGVERYAVRQFQLLQQKVDPCESGDRPKQDQPSVHMMRWFVSLDPWLEQNLEL
jgi:hypothetical protein